MNEVESVVQRTFEWGKWCLLAVSCVLLVLTFTNTAGAYSQRAGSSFHDQSLPHGGRLPGQPDFDRIGKTTYRFLPKKQEYEIHRDGRPISFAHVDYAPGEVVYAGPNTPLPLSEDQPSCGEGGHRISAVYSHRPWDGAPVPVEQIQSIIRRMNWKIVQQSSQASGGARPLQMAVDCAGETIRVYSVATSDNNLPTIEAALSQYPFGMPFGDESLRYLVFDSENNSAATGIATHAVDSKKKFNNLNVTQSRVAIAYNEIWTTHVPMHELFHTFGASQGGSTEPPPYGTKKAHCSDGLDILCYEDRSGPLPFSETRCPASAGYDQPTMTPIDCGGDTYFNPNPPAGSWLATHWNTGEQENPFLVNASDPRLEVETGAPVKVGSVEATVAGKIAANGELETKYRFEYGTTQSYGLSAPASFTSVGSTMYGVPVKNTMTGLTPGVEYHYRLVAMNSAGTVYGADKTFLTALWKIQPTPSFEKSVTLADVSCSGKRICTAVGAELKQPETPLALRSENGEWVQQATPNPSEQRSRFTSVSCPAGNACVAVGATVKAGASFDSPFAARWNGTSWTNDAPPSPAGATGGKELQSVACVSSSYCVAVGLAGLSSSFDVSTLIEVWNGSSWSIISSPNAEGWASNELHSVACTSTTSCVAVGRSRKGDGQKVAYSYQLLIERWNGSKWSVEAAPATSAEAELNDVSCGSSTACMAVGVDGSKAVAVAWDGSKWSHTTPVTSPLGGFGGVSCPSATCVALQSQGGQIWNGSAWALDPVSAVSGEISANLRDISCWDTTTCVGAGSYFDPVLKKSAALIEQRSVYMAPVVSTTAADKIDLSVATLNGTVNTGGGDGGYYFEYGKTTAYGSKAVIPAKEFAASGEDVKVSQKIEGLTPNTTYHFRLVAFSDGGLTKGPDRKFTTHDVMPIKAVSFGSAGSANGQFKFPRGIAVDASGNLWVADGENHRIEKFNEAGEFLSAFGSFGTGNGQFNTPVDIALTASGDIWVTDAYNCRVQKFSTSGTYLAKFGSCGSGEGQFVEPSGIAIGPNGHIWVTDHRYARISEFTASGELIKVLSGDESGMGQGEFSGPQGITVDSSGHVWVADSDNYRIQELSASGDYLSQFGTAGTGDGQFTNPSQIEIAASGLIWVADRDGRVQEFNSSGEFLGKIAGFFEPWGLGAGPEGSIYVSNSRNDRVEKWRLATAPSTTTLAAQEVVPTQAKLRGTINAAGFATSYHFEYGPTTAYGTKVPVPDKAAPGTTKATEFTEVVSGLTPKTTYHYRLVAVSSGGSSYGQDMSFATPVLWSITSSPNPSAYTSAPTDELKKVSCASSEACMAVGRDVDAANIEQALVERWDGSKWSVVSFPSPAGAKAVKLEGISCPSASACIAVGSYKNEAGTWVSLSASWNGSSWSVVSTPNPSGATLTELLGVSCTSSTACTAIGRFKGASGFHNTLAERWNGSAWTIQSTPDLGAKYETSTYEARLNAVSCTWTTNCLAVGKFSGLVKGKMVETGIVESWNGTNWSTVSVPGTSTSLNTISCPSLSACVITGAGDGLRVFSGTWWSESMPNFSDISCSAFSSCWGVTSVLDGSSYVPRVMAWDGKEWAVEQTTTPAADAPPAGKTLVLKGGFLAGVSCTSICFAVGKQMAVYAEAGGKNPSEYTRTLVERRP